MHNKSTAERFQSTHFEFVHEIWRTLKELTVSSSPSLLKNWKKCRIEKDASTDALVWDAAEGTVMHRLVCLYFVCSLYVCNSSSHESMKVQWPLYFSVCLQL